jgi:hypothetical protein
MMFIKKSANSHGWVNPRDVEQLWMDHFDYFYREYDEFVFPMTIHPDISGRPHVLLMHERLAISKTADTLSSYQVELLNTSTNTKVSSG